MVLDEGKGISVLIGGRLTDKWESALAAFVRANADMFDWTTSDVPGVPREVIKNQLVVCSGCRPVEQKIRQQSPEKQEFITQ